MYQKLASKTNEGKYVFLCSDNANVVWSITCAILSMCLYDVLFVPFQKKLVVNMILVGIGSESRAIWRCNKW